MERLVQCQVSFVSWGEKARYKKAKFGLLRKGCNVYLAIFFNNSPTIKLPIDASSISLFPLAIRFEKLGKDLLIKDKSNERCFNNIMRCVKILLKKDRLEQCGKTESLRKLIRTLPELADLRPEEIRVAPSRVNMVFDNGEPNTNQLRCISNITDQSVQNSFYKKFEPTCGIGHPYSDSNKRKVSKQLDNRHLKEIRISGLESIPKEIWFRTSLHQLTLTSCNLTRVPKQLEIFATSLSYLDLSHNMIEKVPRTFCCKMKNLESLHLKSNLIETLPIEIKFFRKLVRLDMSNNRLRMLPSTFSDLRSLKYLNVANNQLSQLPAFSRQDIRLNQLDVSYNPLDGASDKANTYEVYPSLNDNYMNDAAQLGYHENLLGSLNNGLGLSSRRDDKCLSLFQLTLLKIVSCDRLLKLSSEEALPQTIVSTMQKEIFKCYKCRKMSILPAYNSTDILDYVDHVQELTSTGNYRHGMTFMKLLCRNCFGAA